MYMYSQRNVGKGKRKIKHLGTPAEVWGHRQISVRLSQIASDVSLHCANHFSHLASTGYLLESAVDSAILAVEQLSICTFSYTTTRGWGTGERGVGTHTGNHTAPAAVLCSRLSAMFLLSAG